jgi:hypothetical protein
MPLPKISTPIYELVIPSSGKKIKYRPFLVKEEKVLIIAMESEDTAQIGNAVKDVIKSCIITRGIKVEELSTFDIEYLFLNIRGKSVGEEVEVLVTCPDDGVTKVPMTINLDEIEVQIDDNHSKDIRLDDTLILRMKYPSMEVYNEEESWSAKDCTKKELRDFVEQLSSKQFKEIENFFATMPKLSHTIIVKNPNTGVENEVVLEGLGSFFA